MWHWRDRYHILSIHLTCDSHGYRSTGSKDERNNTVTYNSGSSDRLNVTVWIMLKWNDWPDTWKNVLIGYSKWANRASSQSEMCCYKGSITWQVKSTAISVITKVIKTPFSPFLKCFIKYFFHYLIMGYMYRIISPYVTKTVLKLFLASSKSVQ